MKESIFDIVDSFIKYRCFVCKKDIESDKNIVIVEAKLYKNDEEVNSHTQFCHEECYDFD